MNDHANEMTLDPPGRIAIIGAGPLGLEATLYGRFLGYDVTTFERGEVGQSLRDCLDQPLPMLPSLCLSPLAWSAISAQLGSGDTLPAESLPLTIGQWLDDGLQRLARTDLLRGRILTGREVVAVELLEVSADRANDAQYPCIAGEMSAGEDAEVTINDEIPADFRLSVLELNAQSHAGQRDVVGDPRAETLDFEAVILAIGNADPGSIAGIDRCQASPYFFRLGDSEPAATAVSDRSAEQSLRRGWKEIVQVFAALGGRAELDLYRPIRL